MDEVGTGQKKLDADVLLARVRAIQEEVARLPVLDDRARTRSSSITPGHFD